MMKLLLSILLTLIVIGGIAALAVITAKVLMVIGLIYLCMTVLKSLF